MGSEHNPNAGWDGWQTEFRYPLMSLLACDASSPDGSAGGIQSTGHFHVERILAEECRMGVTQPERIDLVVMRVLDETVPVKRGGHT